METLWQDVRFGLRVLMKNRGVTLVALLTLALGIGANSAIFSVTYGVLLQPLPYPESDKLVFLTEWSRQVPNMSFSCANYDDLRDQNKVFESLFAFRSNNYILTGAGDAERLSGRQVTSGMFATMRLQPVIGRAFVPDEDKPGAGRVVLLGEGFWTRRFARDPGIVGKSLTLNGESYTVIGVLPGRVHGTWRQFDVWVSLGRLEDTLGGAKQRGNHPGIYVIARRKPGVSEEQARTEVVAIAQRLAQQYPQQSANQSMTLQSLQEAVVGDVRRPLWVLLGAVGFVLLMACANVANILLGRAASREREIAIRLAMGAGRLRLVRQLLTESVVLSVVGGALALGLGYAGMKGLLAIAPTGVPRLTEVSMDWHVLAFTAAISLLAGILFGLVPAIQASRPDVHDTLKEGGRTGSGGGRHRLRQPLVVAEISLALVLLVGAGLTLKSFYRILHTDAGFNPDHVAVASVSIPETRYRTPEQVRAFKDRVLERVRGLPGVDVAGSVLPLLGGAQTAFLVEGRPVPAAGEYPSTDISGVSPDYFRAMGVRLLRGRAFTDADDADAPKVCIVDATFVQTYWPNEDPLGKRLKLNGIASEDPWREIVGVVAHVKNYGVDQDSRVETYLPYKQNPRGPFTLVLRTRGEPSAVISSVRAAVQAVDSEIPIFNTRTMDDIISERAASRRLTAVLLGVFAAVALSLAAVGLYGVESYLVAQRTHEIGVRMALGAQPADVLRLVMRQGIKLTALGIVLGLAAALALTRLMQTILFGVSATDPWTYTALAVLLAAVTLLATYVPARRATEVDPVIALRYE